jgi:lycopene cyclase domain-containing protein
MATYITLNLIVLALVFVALRPKTLTSKSRLVTLGMVLLLTLVFDNIMIMADLFYYNETKLLGVYVGSAPLEDFFYALLAVMVVPTLWNRFAKRETKP